MHHIWTVPEVARRILQAESVGRKELALMVRVCSWFWDIAAPVLWEELSLGNSPRALELLLPPEVQVNFHKWCKNMRLGTKPAACTFGRFDIHRKFVRRFEVWLGLNRENVVLEALVLSGYTRQIFPNIRHLSIVLQENQPRYIKIVNSLMSPRINSIGIRYFSTATMLDSAVSSIIYILQEAKFPLVKLTIDAGNSGNGVSQATWKAQSRFLASLTSLRRLVLRGLSKETFPLFVVASQLPELVDLKIETPHAWIELLERADVVHETGFTVLKRLIVDNSQAQSSRAVLLAFLPCFASTTFEELQVSFPPIFDQTNRGDLIPLQQFGALTTFEANWRNQGDLRREDVGHLFESHLLTHVSLVGEGAATLFDNKMIHWAAEAWPHLQALAIVEWDGELAESTPYNLSLPTVTLQGLAPLAVYCPSLQSISIHIDARNTPSSTVSTPGLSVQKLVFRDSHIGERIDEVAAFITCMWPNVELDSKRIMEEWYQGDRASRREQEFGARWRQVWEKVAKSSGEKLKLVR